MLREEPSRKGSPRERPRRERGLRGGARAKFYDGHGHGIYIEARYSKSYKITAEELKILRERVHDLAVRVRQACAEKLASFCGAENVGELPEVPALSVLPGAAGPEAPPVDDTAAFQAWRDELSALAYERGKEAGVSEGFDRGEKQGFDRGKDTGRLEGVAEGQVRALLSILAARGLAVEAAERARIEACRDPEVLHRWVTRAVTVAAVADLFTP